MPDVNIPLLQKAVEWAEVEAAKPDQSQSQWFQEMWVTSAEEIGRSCGTCYCIAGWIAANDPDLTQCAPGDFFDFTDADGRAVIASMHAQGALGLSGGQADRLFSGGNTIEDVRRIAEEIAGERL